MMSTADYIVLTIVGILGAAFLLYMLIDHFKYGRLRNYHPKPTEPFPHPNGTWLKISDTTLKSNISMVRNPVKPTIGMFTGYAFYTDTFDVYHRIESAEMQPNHPHMPVSPSNPAVVAVVKYRLIRMKVDKKKITLIPTTHVNTVNQSNYTGYAAKNWVVVTDPKQIDKLDCLLDKAEREEIQRDAKVVAELNKTLLQEPCQ